MDNSRSAAQINQRTNVTIRVTGFFPKSRALELVCRMPKSLVLLRRDLISPFHTVDVGTIEKTLFPFELLNPLTLHYQFNSSLVHCFNVYISLYSRCVLSVSE